MSTNKRRESDQIRHDAGSMGSHDPRRRKRMDKFSTVSPWRDLIPGCFKMTKVAPAMLVLELMPLQGELLKKLAAVLTGRLQ